MQCKDLDDAQFLFIVEAARRSRPYGANGASWATRFDVETLYAYARSGRAIDSTLLLAKANKLIRRGLMSGCACGCRGDYEMTDTGKDLVYGGRHYCETDGPWADAVARSAEIDPGWWLDRDECGHQRGTALFTIRCACGRSWPMLALGYDVACPYSSGRD